MFPSQLFPPDQASLSVRSAQEGERSPSLFTVGGDSLPLPPTEGAHLGPRDFYAHAGFAIGAPFLTAHVGCRPVVYPFDYKPVLEFA